MLYDKNKYEGKNMHLQYNKNSWDITGLTFLLYKYKDSNCLWTQCLNWHINAPVCSDTESLEKDTKSHNH